MEITILILFLANIFFALLNNNKKNHGVAILNAFVAGILLATFIQNLLFF